MNNQDNEKVFQKSQINWYPGHMKKTREEIIRLMPVIDFVIEVVDGRVPESSRIKDIDNIIKNKPHIIVITKKDLCDIDETTKWINYYESIGKNIVFINTKNNNDDKLLMTKLNEIVKTINEKRIEKGLKVKEARALIIGVPNSGKSTIINVIAKKKVAKTGNVPGFTKSLSWLKANNFLLLDTPGILWPKFENEITALNLASTSAIREEVLPIHEVAYHILKMLNKYYPAVLKNRYGLDNIVDNFEDDYKIISQKIGAITKGNEVDYNKISRFIINDIRVGNIKNITFDRR